MKSPSHVSLPILTNSATKTWAECAAKYKLAYVDLVRPIHDGDALVMGTLLHAALEAWWKASQTGPARECPECAPYGDGADQADGPHEPRRGSCDECNGSGLVGPDEWLRAALVPLSREQDPFRRASAEALIAGYHARWSAMKWDGAPYDGAPIEVVGVEVEFNGPLLNPDTGKPSKSLQRGGKIDVLVRVSGDVWIVEHKSSSEDFGPGTDYRRRLRLDTQVSGYHVGARLLGHSKVAGVLYDVLGKTAQRPKKATKIVRMTKGTDKNPSRPCAGQQLTDETPDEYQERVLEEVAGGDYFARFEVVRLAHEEEDAARDTWARMGEIRDAKRLGRYPKNASNCTRWGRSCAYLPICEGTATAGDGTRYRKAETAHEELGGQGGENAAKQAA